MFEDRAAMSAREGERRSERGTIAVLMACLLTAIMGFAAFGFDLSYVREAKEEMANAADAAAHAASINYAITGNQQTAIAAAQNMSPVNTVLGQPVSFAQSDFVFGNYDFTLKTFTAAGSPANAVRVVGQNITTGDGKVQLTFARALGIAEASVAQTAVAAYHNRYFQVELQASDDWICEIDNAADAAVDLLDYLDTSGSAGTDWIGLDEFTGRTQPVSALSPNGNVGLNYSAIRRLWRRDNTVLGTQNQNWPSASPPAAPQSIGITVCSKANATPGGFAGPPSLPAWAGGYRQCPAANPPAQPVLPSGQQFNYPNHSYLGLNCSDGGPTGLYAGTDLAAAINDGVTKLNAIGQSSDPHELILVTDGTPMACTGIGGGGLCGHTYGSDGATPPAGKTSGSFWDPCCANGLTCGATVSYEGYTFGGGAWGDGSPGNSPNGSTACDAAHQLVKNAMDAATAAKNSNIDLWVIGFFSSQTGVGQSFDLSLVENKGSGVVTSDSTQISSLLQQIPRHVPTSLVR